MRNTPSDGSGPDLPDGVVPLSGPLDAAAARLGIRPVPPAVEAALTIVDVCKFRSISRRTGERERAAGLWPPPDFYVGTGRRKQPRWLRRTIEEHHNLRPAGRKGVAR